MLHLRCWNAQRFQMLLYRLHETDEAETLHIDIPAFRQPRRQSFWVYLADAVRNSIPGALLIYIETLELRMLLRATLRCCTNEVGRLGG